MTDRATIIQRYDEFGERLTSLLTEFKDAIAPDWDKEEETPCYHDEDCVCVPNDNIVPTEFVLLVNWTDFDKHKSVVTPAASSHLAGWHVKGLLEDYRDRLRGC